MPDWRRFGGKVCEKFGIDCHSYDWFLLNEENGEEIDSPMDILNRNIHSIELYVVERDEPLIDDESAELLESSVSESVSTSVSSSGCDSESSKEFEIGIFDNCKVRKNIPHSKLTNKPILMSEIRGPWRYKEYLEEDALHHQKQIQLITHIIVYSFLLERNSIF